MGWPAVMRSVSSAAGTKLGRKAWGKSAAAHEFAVQLGGLFFQVVQRGDELRTSSITKSR